MRFVFDQPYLLDGISISIIALAMFGIPSALDLALTKLGVEQQPVPLKGSLFDGVKDTIREWWLVVRCSFVGVWVGIVPGLGSQVVDWLAYGHAAQSCKGGTETFGKGDVRGVIAPESANDAKDGGDLITTLLLGFPQGVVTALFIVALLAWGYLPGPEMLKKNPELVYSVVWLQGISGIVGTIIGFTLAGQLAKLAEVRYTFMVPIMFIFILLGAFSVNRDPIDLLVVIVFGALGYLDAAALRLPSTGDDTSSGAGRLDGKISLPFGSELRFYLAHPPGGHCVIVAGVVIVVFHYARQNQSQRKGQRKGYRGFFQQRHRKV